MSVRKRAWTTVSSEEKEAWVVDYFDQARVRRLKTFVRKKEADDYAATTHIQVRDGTHVADRASVTIRDAGEAWIKAGQQDGLEVTTIAQRRQHLSLHILPFMGRAKLSHLNVATIKAFRDELWHGNDKLPENDLRRNRRSADMVKRVLVSLGALLAEAQDSGLTARNPVYELSRRARHKKVAQGERRRRARLQVGEDIPTPGEIAVIIRSAEGRWRPLLVAAIYTGMRASELRGLRWVDVDLKHGRVHIRQRADRYAEIGMPKSEAGQRTIPIGPFVVSTLREWKLACPKGELGLVFPNGRGNVEDHANIVARGFLPAQIAAGVVATAGSAKYTGLHALRHFFASWCINPVAAGGQALDAKTVQHLLGHASIVMTLDTYGHLFPKVDDNGALAMAEQQLLSAVHAT